MRCRIQCSPPILWRQFVHCQISTWKLTLTRNNAPLPASGMWKKIYATATSSPYSVSVHLLHVVVTHWLHQHVHSEMLSSEELTCPVQILTYGKIVTVMFWHKISINTDFDEVKRVCICIVQTLYTCCKFPRKSVVVLWKSAWYHYGLQWPKRTYTTCVWCPHGMNLDSLDLVKVHIHACDCHFSSLPCQYVKCQTYLVLYINMCSILQ